MKIKIINKELSIITLIGIGAVIPRLTFCQNSSTAKPDTKKPNVVLILADDLGYETLSCNGSLSYKTPNLDQLASQGIRFTQFYSNPLCSPSRVGIMTGKYNFRNYEYFEYLNPSQKTFGNLMQDAGYVTAIAGKWQLNGIRWQYPSALDPSTVNHVPGIVVWPSVIKKARVYDGLISFPDFLPTLADIAGVDACSYDPDGISFMPVIRGKEDPIQDEIFMHYSPEWGNFQANRWVFNSTYSLYQNGDFYNTEKDPLEEHKLTNLTPEEQEIHDRFDKILKEKEKEFPFEWSNASDKNPRAGSMNFGPRPAGEGQGPARQMPNGQRP